MSEDDTFNQNTWQFTIRYPCLIHQTPHWKWASRIMAYRFYDTDMKPNAFHRNLCVDWEKSRERLNLLMFALFLNSKAKPLDINSKLSKILRKATESNGKTNWNVCYAGCANNIGGCILLHTPKIVCSESLGRFYGISEWEI